MQDATGQELAPHQPFLKKKTTTLILIYSIMWEVWVGTGAAATAMVCASSESWFAAATFAAVAATLALRSSYKGM